MANNRLCKLSEHLSS